MRDSAWALPGLSAFMLLELASATALGLLGLRMFATSSSAFSFLGWNLLLAWVPVGAALALHVGHRRQVPLLALLALSVTWLAFFPNAPYIVTDLKHLHASGSGAALLWFDATMLILFGACGLSLGFSSLQLVQGVVADRLGRSCGWVVVAVSVVACAAGVYLGRVQRLNSWDLIRRPGLMVGLVHNRAQDPLGNPYLLAAVLAGTAGMAAGYALWIVAGRRARLLLTAPARPTRPRRPTPR